MAAQKYIWIFEAAGQKHVALADDEQRAVELCGIDPVGQERVHWEVTRCSVADGPQHILSVKSRAEGG